MSEFITHAYNHTWMAWSLVLMVAMLVGGVFAKKSPMVVRLVALAWVAQEFAMFTRVAFWEIAKLTNDNPELQHAAWSKDAKWVLAIPLLVAIYTGSNWILKEMGPRWFMAGISSVLVGLVIATLYWSAPWQP